MHEDEAAKIGQEGGMTNNLKQLRDARGWTHQQVADAVGISKGHYVKIERGERSVKPVLLSLARAFGVLASEISDDIDFDETPYAIDMAGEMDLHGKADFASERTGRVILPPANSLGFIVVRGDALYPRYMDGEALIYELQPSNPRDLVDQYALVQSVENDELIVRMLRADPRAQIHDSFVLEAHNAPPVRARVVEAHRIIGSLSYLRPEDIKTI